MASGEVHPPSIDRLNPTVVIGFISRGWFRDLTASGNTSTELIRWAPG